MKNKYCLIPLLLSLLINNSFAQNVNSANAQSGEVMYHLFQRSFYDSNGDSHGDLNGVKEKLDYLQDLGITSILLLPLYESVFYHNYFSGDFEKIDGVFGSMQDLIGLIKAVHARGMKIYLDMETQYVTEDHLWWKDSYGNLSSPYSDYILYDDAAHTKPSSIIFGLTSLTGYNNATKKIATVNLKSKNVLEYNYKLFKYFADPDGDGKFDDGADGFRLDHMMDNLDGKPQLTNLFADFWSPLFARLRQVNPRLTFIAEQANWMSYGFDYFKQGNVDRVFGFGLQYAITSFDKKKIEAIADTTLNMTPKGKQQVVFIENHDMKRFASAVNKNPGKEKVGAALSLLLGGIPSIYYGQELGMFGSGGFNKFNNTDANDIPQREAFEWNRSDDGNGMAIWYKDSGPWWDSTNLKPNDGVSLEEEKGDSNSLYNFYRKVIALRKSNEAISLGAYKTIDNDNDSVLTFMRSFQNKKVLVVVNLSASIQSATIGPGASGIDNFADPSFRLLYRSESRIGKGRSFSYYLKPYAIEVWGTD
jgi:alpha-amylase